MSITDSLSQPVWSGHWCVALSLTVTEFQLVTHVKFFLLLLLVLVTLLLNLSESYLNPAKTARIAIPIQVYHEEKNGGVSINLLNGSPLSMAGSLLTSISFVFQGFLFTSASKSTSSYRISLSDKILCKKGTKRCREHEVIEKGVILSRRKLSRIRGAFAKPREYKDPLALKNGMEVVSRKATNIKPTLECNQIGYILKRLTPKEAHHIFKILESRY